MLQSLESLLPKSTADSAHLESSIYESLYGSFKILCAASTTTCRYFKNKDDFTQPDEPCFKLIELQQSALMNTLILKSTFVIIIIINLLKLLFQYSFS